MKNKLMMMVIGLAAAGMISVGCSSSQTPADEAPVEQEQVQEEQEAAEEEEEEAADDEEAVEEEEAALQVGAEAVAVVKNGEGEEIGEVRFTQLEEGVQVKGSISGLEPGKHGFHVHEGDECEAPDFMSAGGHYNPGGHEHGAPENEADERHAGDFGNVVAGEDGVAEIDFVDSVITLGGEENDVIGHALIVHFDEDDLVSQPTGDAGGRAGCGLIEASE